MLATDSVTTATNAFVMFANITMIVRTMKRIAKFTPPLSRIYASIHPFNRKMEWNASTNKMGRLHEDICPTVTANEYRSVGNVIWEIYEEI